MEIQAVIFDIDNTMYDYSGCDRKAKDACREYCSRALALDPSQFDLLYRRAETMTAERIGYSCSAVHNRLIRFQCMLELMGKPLFPHARALYHQYWDTLLNEMKPEKGLPDFLDYLKARGISIGIGTNMTAYIQYRKLEALGVESPIDWMVTSEECGVEKPASQFFDLCVKKSGFPAAQCLFIGDSLNGDIRGAAACGMQTIWFTGLLEERPGDLHGFTAADSFEACRRLV